MIVVSDTSPINYLVLIGQIDFLPALFGRVVIPAAVLTELQHAGTPDIVRQWVDNSPPWLEVESPAHVDPQIRLGHGEAEAIIAERIIQKALQDDADRRSKKHSE